MSFTGGALECVLCLGCTRWAWKRCTYIGAYDSESWPPATAEELAPIPRLCRLILANYEDDLARPRFQPQSSNLSSKDGKGPTTDPCSFSVNPEWVIKRVTYQDARGRCPPYLIYADRDNKELVLAIRGLNLIKESDYKLLMDNSLGRQMFDGGYVHHGLLKAAVWVLNRETVTLRDKWLELGDDYKLVFTGHSLGSGIAALMTVLVVNHRYRFGGIPRNQVRCYAIATARCMSLNLAVKYADVIYSVVLQDDFLPRTATPLEYIFTSIFCLPCFLFLVCLRDTFIPEGRKLKDPRRLYAPGRMYHIVERKFCRCGRFPPQVRTAIPVEGRFEHIVLSCNTTKDHAIIWIEREVRKALENLKAVEPGSATCPPMKQTMERMETLKIEHKHALEKVKSLSSQQDDSEEPNEEESGEGADESNKQVDGEDPSSLSGDPKNIGTVSWDELVQRLFDRSESGKLLLKKDVEALK